MKNQYKLILNLDKENKEVYEKEYLENNYIIVVNEENLIFLKKENEKNTNIEKENEIIRFSINMFKKYQFNGVRIIDLSNDINSMLKRVENVKKIDYKTDKQNICWQLRNIITREIAKN